MSQTAFMGALTALVVALFAAVWSYCYSLAVFQPAVRAVLTLGLRPLLVNVVPRWWDAWLCRPRPLRGRRRAPRGYRPARPALTPAPMPAVDGIVIVTQDGETFVTEVDPTTPAPEPTASLPVRVAEILAHNEADDHVPVPERTDEGATAEWSPALEVSRERTPPVLVRSEPDAEELRILAALELLEADWRKVPDWLTEWGAKTDAYLEAAKLRSEPHKRWRAGALTFPTGELPRVLVGA